MALVGSITKYRQGYRLSEGKPDPAEYFSCSTAFKILDYTLMEQAKDVAKVSSDSHKSIVSHVNALRHSLLLSAAVNATVKHTVFVLVQNVGCCMSAWNLNSLGWLLFMEIPFAKQVLERSTVIMYRAASPRVSFPVYSSLHCLEYSSRKSCSSLHNTSMYLQVTIASVLLWHFCHSLPEIRNQWRAFMKAFKMLGQQDVLSCSSHASLSQSIGNLLRSEVDTLTLPFFLHVYENVFCRSPGSQHLL